MNNTFKLSPIIETASLAKLYDEEKNLVIVHAGNGKNAKSAYLEKHLDKAVFADLDTQLSEVKNNVSDGGRHPLPNIDRFIKIAGSLGISEKSHVIIYDDKNGANAAARFWWMLKAIGHEKVQVLNGGIQEAERKGLTLNNKTTAFVQQYSCKLKDWKLPLADIDEIEKNINNPDYTIIDVRESNRYNGFTEPIDLIAGHIPGAINIPFIENLDNNGLFLSPTELKQKYTHIFKNTKPDNIAVHCGSGVTACHTILAMAYAGLDIPKLYVGSWSEWSRNNKQVVTYSGNQ